MDWTLLFFALLPILSLMVALGVFKLPAHWVGLGTLFLAGLIAYFFFYLEPDLLFLGALEGFLIALWPIMIVIIAAIFTYNLAEKTGSLGTIEKILTGITKDKRIQVLILAWGFGGFLEAVAGYGTAVAIPASILIMLGFKPFFAAVISLIANTVPTAFGAVGIPVWALGEVTGLDIGPLSLAVALQLTPFIILIPFILVMLTANSFKGIKGVFWITLASGLAFAVPNLLAAAFLGEQLPALLGSLSSMGLTIFLAKRLNKEENTSPSEQKVGLKPSLIAWLPYILITAFILFTSKLLPPVYEALSTWKWTLSLGSGIKELSFSFLTPGVLIILAAVIGAMVQKAPPALIISTFKKTLIQLWKSALTVTTILAMSKIMGYGGMIDIIAQALVEATGALYPLFSPLIGTLGTFVTGSDTTSNILFGKLQRDVALNLDLSPYWLAAANTAGATAGKMISPQSIAVATSATGLQGQEGNILGQTLIFCLFYVLILGLVIFFTPLAWLGF